MSMINQFETVQKFGKDGFDATVKSLATWTKGAQTLAVETADYTRKAVEHHTATLEKLATARTLENAIEIQTAYAKSAYEGYVAQATKVGELYASMVREIFRPFEGVAATVST